VAQWTCGCGHRNWEHFTKCDNCHSPRSEAELARKRRDSAESSETPGRSANQLEPARSEGRVMTDTHREFAQYSSVKTASVLRRLNAITSAVYNFIVGTFALSGALWAGLGGYLIGASWGNRQNALGPLLVFGGILGFVVGWAIGAWVAQFAVVWIEWGAKSKE